MSQNMLGVALREVHGPLVTMLDRLEGPRGRLWLRRLNRMNRGENPFEKLDSFEVTSYGRTGEGFARLLKKNHLEFGTNIREILRSQSFVPTVNQKYRLIIIKGTEVKDKGLSAIREEAQRRGYGTPPIEVAPLLWEVIDHPEMLHLGCPWLMVMHEPVSLPDGTRCILGLSRQEREVTLSRFRYRDERELHPFLNNYVFIAPQS